MNDPGLDAPIQDAEMATKGRGDEWAEEREEEDMLLDPSRWWFASTASPLIAGTFGPMASAFNVCALVENWRELIPDGHIDDTGIPVKDPAWLYAVNAVSLACALIGNGSLLLNMVGRISFKWAQPITIAGFFLAAILLIVLVSLASSSVFRLHTHEEHALTQAFYFACWAAGLYTVIGILMTITVYGAIAGKYPKQFEINRSQRTLMLQTISFMAYLLVGAAIYHQLEGWQFLDAVFWADFTLLTIGFGTPLVPSTHAGRALIIPYTFGGILALGLVIGSIRSMLLEKGAQKMHARATEKKRQQIVTIQDTEVGKHRANHLRPGKRPKDRATSHHQPERDRRRDEFLAMRHILAHAEKRQRWMALSFSTLNAAALWFVGALVFYKTEYKQGWTYFEAMYFSYVSLITLGYGDLQPSSNCGKAFFVFWSLLAIPTLTVLISDMGSTVVQAIAEATDYVGSLTLLTGDADFWKEVRTNLSALSGGRLFPSSAAAASKRRRAILRRVKHDEELRLGAFPDLLYSRLTSRERTAVADYRHRVADQEPDLTEHERDTLFYHFLLVKEIRAVLADSRAPEPRTYTYDEWAYFLKLLGQDEDADTWHIRRYNKPKKDDEEAPQVGRIVDHEGNPRQWSWLSLRSPLLSQLTEPEWILHRLLEKLHGEMHFQRRTGGGVGEVRRMGGGPSGWGQGMGIGAGDDGERGAVPVSVGLLVKTWSGRSGGSDGEEGIDERLETADGRRSADGARDDDKDDDDDEGETTSPSAGGSGSGSGSEGDHGRGETRQRRIPNGGVDGSGGGGGSGSDVKNGSLIPLAGPV